MADNNQFKAIFNNFFTSGIACCSPRSDNAEMLRCTLDAHTYFEKLKPEFCRAGVGVRGLNKSRKCPTLGKHHYFFLINHRTPRGGWYTRIRPVDIPTHTPTHINKQYIQTHILKTKIGPSKLIFKYLIGKKK